MKLLLQAGWQELRQTGSHLILERNGKIFVLAIHKGKELKKGTIKAILKACEPDE